MKAFFEIARKRYHCELGETVLRISGGVASIADSGNPASEAISAAIFSRLGLNPLGPKLPGQTAGNKFELATASFVRNTFLQLQHLRQGEWAVEKIGGKDLKKSTIAQFEQYAHLLAIKKAVDGNADLAALLGSDYLIRPDVVVFRKPVEDSEINSHKLLVDEGIAKLTSLRKTNGGEPILHASISCKLTIRSDRSQNSRLEALNLIRNRRGKLPHVVVVTAEPLPSRLASVALGSGDIDCVYHMALPELIDSVRDLGLADSSEALNIMVKGKRLRDIADLPLDLAV